MEAWRKVERLRTDALRLLVDAGEGPVECAMLMHITEKAPVQARRWEPKRSDMLELLDSLSF